MTILKIDRLDIRLKGVSAQRGKELMKGLDQELIQQFSNHDLPKHQKNAVRLNHLACDPIQSTREETSSTVRKRVAKRVMESIASHPTE